MIVVSKPMTEWLRIGQPETKMIGGLSVSRNETGCGAPRGHIVPEVERCLARIKYAGATEPSVTTLRALQNAFVLQVPFENLDIIRGKKINLSSDSIYGKIVVRRRGGVCYESNILFHDLLVALGFRVEFLSARMVKGSVAGRDCGHMVLKVSLEYDYLVDVGKGQSCREPLRIDGASEECSEGTQYRVGCCGESYALYGRKSQGEWVPRFYFDTRPRSPAEFGDMNDYHQTSPDSPFTQRAIVTMATSEGRVTLIDRYLTITAGGMKQSHNLRAGDYHENLRRYFGIDLDR